WPSAKSSRRSSDSRSRKKRVRGLGPLGSSAADGRFLAIVYWQWGNPSSGAGPHAPLAHWSSSVQNAPEGARQLPPVHGVFIGQSLLDAHVAQSAPGHAWVMH